MSVDGEDVNKKYHVRPYGALVKKGNFLSEIPVFEVGAGDGIRTHDSLLGNYQRGVLKLNQGRHRHLCPSGVALFAPSRSAVAPLHERRIGCRDARSKIVPF